MNDNYLKQILSPIHEALNFDMSLLDESNRWGELNFKDLTNSIKFTNSLLKAFIEIPYEIISDQAVSELLNGLNEYSTAIIQISNFNLSTNNPKQQRDAIASQLTSGSKLIVEKLSPWVSSYNASGLKGGNKKDKADTFIKEIEELKHQAATLLSSIRQTSSETGVEVHSSDFSEAATEWKDRATNWLIFMGVSLFITVVLAILLVNPAKSISESYFAGIDPIVLSVSKITIIAIMLTLTFWCGRIYKSAMHQYSINKHKATSLSTFKTFVNSTDNEDIRQAILLETTRSIFGNVPTGYFDSKGSHQDSPTTIFELIKSASKKPD